MNATAAGFIVVRKTKSDLKYLGLIALKKDQKKSKGKYDIPKGRIDPGENAYQAALRECQEEAGFQPKRESIYPDKISNGKLDLWISILDYDPIINITPNPETGKMEHLGHRWVSYEEMLNNCLRYLKPMIMSSKIIIEQHEK